MTPEQSAKLERHVASVVVEYGRLTEDGLEDLALISNQLMWSLARLQTFHRQLST